MWLNIVKSEYTHALSGRTPPISETCQVGRLCDVSECACLAQREGELSVGCVLTSMEWLQYWCSDLSLWDTNPSWHTSAGEKIAHSFIYLRAAFFGSLWAFSGEVSHLRVCEHTEQRGNMGLLAQAAFYLLTSVILWDLIFWVFPPIDSSVHNWVCLPHFVWQMLLIIAYMGCIFPFDSKNHERYFIFFPEWSLFSGALKTRFGTVCRSSSQWSVQYNDVLTSLLFTGIFNAVLQLCVGE